MKLKLILIVSAIGVLSSFTVTSIYAQSQYEIPSWIKGVAGFWAEGKITDKDFGEALTFLIDNEIINVPIIDELKKENHNLQSENNDLKQQITKLHSQNADLQRQVTQSSTTEKTQIETKPTPTNYPKVTARIDGDHAVDIITELVRFHNSLSYTERNKLANMSVDQSQFTVGIAYDGNWNLVVTEKNFEFKEYEGLGVSVIPFDCSHNMDYIYSIVGQKIDETGEIRVFLFKNGILIGHEKSEKPYGTATVAGMCDEPLIVTSLD